jgi:hypothetical protein
MYNESVAFIIAWPAQHKQLALWQIQIRSTLMHVIHQPQCNTATAACDSLDGMRAKLRLVLLGVMSKRSLPFGSKVLQLSRIFCIIRSFDAARVEWSNAAAAAAARIAAMAAVADSSGATVATVAAVDVANASVVDTIGNYLVDVIASYS